MGEERPLVREVYPGLVEELARLLAEQGERTLAREVRELRVFAFCECGDDFCQSFRTSDHPPGTPYGPGHRNVVLAPAEGDLILDVVHERIVYVEVLDRAPLVRTDEPTL